MRISKLWRTQRAGIIVSLSGPSLALVALTLIAGCGSSSGTALVPAPRAAFATPASGPSDTTPTTIPTGKPSDTPTDIPTDTPTDPPTPTEPDYPVYVSSDTALPPGETTLLYANWRYGEPLTWAIVEPDGGTLIPQADDSTYLYTAPAAPGVYHVRVTPNNFLDRAATITVTVSRAAASVTVRHRAAAFVPQKGGSR